MKTSEFAEKILGLKLHPFQKKFLDLPKGEKRIIYRRKARQLNCTHIQYLALIDAFEKKESGNESKRN